MTDFSKLEQIFRMMTPADVFASRKISLGRDQDGFVQQLLRILLEASGNGALPTDELKRRLDELLSNKNESEGSEQRKQFNNVIRFYSSAGYLSNDGAEWYKMYKEDGKKPDAKAEFNQIASINVGDFEQKMSIILCDSPFINPAVANAEKVEMFLNFVPGIVMSRCVPYLDVEFAFQRPTLADKPLHSPGMLRFLLGGQNTTNNTAFSTDSANDLLARSRQNIVTDRYGDKVIENTAGMEMFTMPQTLVNPTPVPGGSRYVDVIDPFRPFMSIESFTIDIRPTVGIYSYKTANLVLKLHDRSRLAEISDLVRPQLYVATTLWITYGWRHPDERENPYASFINDNMLVRESYGVSNCQFEFDSVGQVKITLQLFTKGVQELRYQKITSNAYTRLLEEIKKISEEVKRLRTELGGIEQPSISKETRPYIVLDAAERGQFPELDVEETTKAIRLVEKMLNAEGQKHDAGSVKKLVSKLDELFKPNKKEFDFNVNIKKTAGQVVSEKLDNLTKSADPFLMYSEKDQKRKSELGSSKDHPYVKVIEAYNKERQNEKGKEFKTSLVSFGKIFSAFMRDAVLNKPSVIDELQIFFYKFNDSCGISSGKNIAEFPIDMAVFKDQYRNHVMKRGTEAVTVEEFIQLLVFGHMKDHRAVGYGLWSFYEKWDEKNPDENLKKGQEGPFESAAASKEHGTGPFQMPVIDVFIETTFATRNPNKKIDLLTRFNAGGAVANDEQHRSDMMTRIMRIHVFDKSMSPYPLPMKVLASDSEKNAIKFAGESEHIDEFAKQYNDINPTLKNLPPEILEKLNVDAKTGAITIINGMSNQRMKELVSKMMPSIIYGMNSTNVNNANLSSKQDALLATTQMLGNKSARPSPVDPNGAVGGLPLRIIPASMSMNTMGCPLIQYAQLFFIDFNTGTTVDNIYNLTGLTHTIVPGKFESNLTLTYADAYGKYESPSTIIDYAKTLKPPSEEIEKKNSSTKNKQNKK